MAGWLNAIGVLGLAHQAISHVTGTITLSAIDAAKGDLAPALHASTVVFFFFVGAALSGFIVQQPQLHMGRRYGVVLLLESLLLVLSLTFFDLSSISGEYLAAVAVGLQNALATTYSGAVIRTTHMTGIVTDLGLYVGHALRGQPVDRVRARLHVLLLLGFFVGGMGGKFAFDVVGYQAMIVPALVTGLAGAGYIAYVQRQRRLHRTDHAMSVATPASDLARPPARDSRG